MLALCALVLLAQTTPAPTSSPAPASSQSVTAGEDFTIFAFRTNPDGTTFGDISNAMLNVTAKAGKWQANASAGYYNFPTVGFGLANTSQAGANTRVFSELPLAAVQYNFDPHVSVAAGKFAALLGQESPFTWQNADIQRGLGWNMEPTLSRGVQGSYANGPLTLTLQENDAYYSGSNRAFEGLIGYAPASTTNVQFAAIVPGANVPPNPTVSVGNKAEYDLMLSQTIGKLQLLPYYLWVTSPSSASLGYTHAEHASAAVLIGTWTFSPQWLLALRYEDARNQSGTTDVSPNADLVGFGPGSSAQSYTITPTLHFDASGVLRLEFSNVRVSTGTSQSRFGFELGVMH